MANPFAIRGFKECDQCGSHLMDGDQAYYHDGDILCNDCAEEAGVVCDCGGYKKEEYDLCYTCNQESF